MKKPVYLKQIICLLMLFVIFFILKSNEAAIPTVLFGTAKDFTRAAVTEEETPVATEGVTGWLRKDGEFYYYQDGQPTIGWLELDGEKYYFHRRSEDGYFKGQLATGWLKVKRHFYYFREEDSEDGPPGSMVTGDQTVDGRFYKFRDDGSVYCVCLDAGHVGYYNHSPVNSEFVESVMAWKLHTYLKEDLEAYGFKVITTRESMFENLSPAERGYKAAGADLMISIHSDASSNPDEDAPTAYCTIRGTADEIGATLANVIHETIGTTYPGAVEHRYSKERYNTDYYGVVRTAALLSVPSILLEHSYHTNPHTVEFLVNEDCLKTLAQAEADAIAEYFLG